MSGEPLSVASVIEKLIEALELHHSRTQCRWLAQGHNYVCVDINEDPMCEACQRYEREDLLIGTAKLALLSVERPALSVAKHGGATRRPRRKEPTAEQWQALRDYAREHGRQWKAHLREDWTAGRDSGFLRQVRNQFGPRWLAKVRLQDEVQSDTRQ